MKKVKDTVRTDIWIKLYCTAYEHVGSIGINELLLGISRRIDNQTIERSKTECYLKIQEKVKNG